MSRAEFIELLARAVAEGWISEEEAAALLRQFDEDPVLVGRLPLVATDAIDGYDMDRAQIYLAKAMLLVFDVPKVQQVEVLQDWFMAEARALAPLAATDVAGWQTQMRELVRAHMIQQTQMGLGRAISPSEGAALFETINGQLAFLSRFAEELTIKLLLEQPMSQQQVAARSDLYAGAGRAAWYQAQDTDLPDGWIVDYESVDDKGTCSRCLAAQQAGPYLPGEGAQPGDVCLGRGQCRCKRVPRYDPETAARLRGQQE